MAAPNVLLHPRAQAPAAAGKKFAASAYTTAAPSMASTAGGGGGAADLRDAQAAQATVLLCLQQLHQSLSDRRPGEEAAALTRILVDAVRKILAYGRLQPSKKAACDQLQREVKFAVEQVKTAVDSAEDTKNEAARRRFKDSVDSFAFMMSCIVN